jgi:hypothetical protein
MAKAGAKKAKASEADGAEVETLQENSKGQPYLNDDSFKPKVIKPLVSAVREEAKAKVVFGDARDDLIKAKKKLSDLCHKYRDNFEFDELTGVGTYAAGDIVIKWNTKDTITSEVLSGPISTEV